MEELKKLSKQPVQLSETDETNLPQVHAMNCLKEIFKSATLGKRSESHMADGLQISADSLNSEMYVSPDPCFALLIFQRWAIRNCGLLLLRSLIDCLFGTSESKQSTEAGWDGRSIKLSYDKYPALPELLLKLLNTEISNSNEVNAPVIGAVESVFPALDIIRRAGPPDSNRAAIFDQVCKHLGSKVWHVREIAARTVCTLLMQDGWSAEIRKLIDSCDESTNKAHGTLIAIRFFLERRLDLNPSSLHGMRNTDDELELADRPRHTSDTHYSSTAIREIFISGTCLFSASSSQDRGHQHSLPHLALSKYEPASIPAANYRSSISSKWP